MASTINLTLVLSEAILSDIVKTVPILQNKGLFESNSVLQDVVMDNESSNKIVKDFVKKLINDHSYIDWSLGLVNREKITALAISAIFDVIKEYKDWWVDMEIPDWAEGFDVMSSQRDDDNFEQLFLDNVIYKYRVGGYDLATYITKVINGGLKGDSLGYLTDNENPVWDFTLLFLSKLMDPRK